MDINYEFKITDLHVVPQAGELTNVVKRVSWQIIGTTTDVNGKQHTYTHYQATTIKLDSQNTFIQSEELTEETVLGWVLAIENQRFRNIDWIKQNMIYKRLDEMINPTLEKMVKPFWEQQ